MADWAACIGASLAWRVSGTLGAIVGDIINRQFDGTITPLAIGFVASSIVAIAAWQQA